MRIQYWAMAIILLGVIYQCSSSLSSKFATSKDFVLLSTKDVEPNTTRWTSCDTNEYYAPDPMHLNHTPMREVKVNFHFMNSSDLKNNIPREEQYPYIKELVNVLNLSLGDNMKMQLPRENNTPALPIRFRYKLSPDKDIPGDNGVYEHIDDELYFFVKSGKYRNNSDRRVIKKYAINPDSVLNIFMMPHHPDSVNSKKYRADASGIALGSDLKVSGQWIKKPNAWSLRGIFNHEIGHVLGLSHSWNTNDGCDDTPLNPNCWNWGNTAPCDSFASSNVMDYNAHQASWTPCQLGKVFKYFSKEGSRQRKIIIPSWCSLDTNQNIHIKENIHWYGAKDLNGYLFIDNGGTLTIHCRTSIPPNGKIVIAPKGKLILNNGQLHNACNKTWNGIELLKNGQNTGQVFVMGDYAINNTQEKVLE